MPKSSLEIHDGDCPPCQAGDHKHCLENLNDDTLCDCAEGGHL